MEPKKSLWHELAGVVLNIVKRQTQGLWQGATTAPSAPYPEQPTLEEQTSGYSMGRSLPGLIPTQIASQIPQLAKSALSMAQNWPIWTQRAAILEEGYKKMKPEDVQIARMLDMMAFAGMAQPQGVGSIMKAQKAVNLRANLDPTNVLDTFNKSIEQAKINLGSNESNQYLARAAKARQWLEDNGYGKYIKSQPPVQGGVKSLK